MAVGFLVLSSAGLLPFIAGLVLLIVGINNKSKAMIIIGAVILALSVLPVLAIILLLILSSAIF